MLSKTVVRLASFLYAIALFYIVFIHGERHRLVSWTDRINLIPVRNIILYYQSNFHQSNLYINLILQIFGNILLFLPFGFLAKCLFPQKRISAIVLYGLLLSIGIELTQLFLQIGICDIDDVILNTTGAAAGAFLYMKIKWGKK